MENGLCISDISPFYGTFPMGSSAMVMKFNALSLESEPTTISCYPNYYLFTGPNPENNNKVEPYCIPLNQIQNNSSVSMSVLKVPVYESCPAGYIEGGSISFEGYKDCISSMCQPGKERKWLFNQENNSLSSTEDENSVSKCYQVCDASGTSYLPECHVTECLASNHEYNPLTESCEPYTVYNQATLSTDQYKIITKPGIVRIELNHEQNPYILTKFVFYLNNPLCSSISLDFNDGARVLECIYVLSEEEISPAELEALIENIVSQLQETIVSLKPALTVHNDNPYDFRTGITPTQFMTRYAVLPWEENNHGKNYLYAPMKIVAADYDEFIIPPSEDEVCDKPDSIDCDPPTPPPTIIGVLINHLVPDLSKDPVSHVVCEAGYEQQFFACNGLVGSAFNQCMKNRTCNPIQDCYGNFIKTEIINNQIVFLSCEDGQYEPVSSICPSNFHKNPNTDSCEPNRIDCTDTYLNNDNVITAFKDWNFLIQEYNSCYIDSCEEGSHIENNLCALDIKTCSGDGIEVVGGSQTWNGSWSECIPQSSSDCGSGYHFYQNKCFTLLDIGDENSLPSFLSNGESLSFDVSNFAGTPPYFVSINGGVPIELVGNTFVVDGSTLNLGSLSVVFSDSSNQSFTYSLSVVPKDGVIPFNSCYDKSLFSLDESKGIANINYIFNQFNQKKECFGNNIVSCKDGYVLNSDQNICMPIEISCPYDEIYDKTNTHPTADGKKFLIENSFNYSKCSPYNCQTGNAPTFGDENKNYAKCIPTISSCEEWEIDNFDPNFIYTKAKYSPSQNTYISNVSSWFSCKKSECLDPNKHLVGEDVCVSNTQNLNIINRLVPNQIIGTKKREWNTISLKWEDWEIDSCMEGRSGVSQEGELYCVKNECITENKSSSYCEDAIYNVNKKRIAMVNNGPIWIEHQISTNSFLFQKLKESDYPQAKCYDGSQGGFFYRKGIGSGENKWIIAIQGGGACGLLPLGNHTDINQLDLAHQNNLNNNNTCYELDSQTSNFVLNDQNKNSYIRYFKELLSNNLLVSSEKNSDLSKTYFENDVPLENNKSDSVDHLGFLSYLITENPDFYSWNHIIIKYCSQDSWLGNGESNGKYHQGYNILTSVIDYLKNKDNTTLIPLPSLNESDNIIVTGYSAGGIALSYYGDHISDKINEGLEEEKKISFLIDSGELPKVIHNDFISYNDFFKYNMKHLWKTNFNLSISSNLNKSIFLSETNIETPTFIISDLFDYEFLNYNAAVSRYLLDNNLDLKFPFEAYICNIDENNEGVIFNNDPNYLYLLESFVSTQYTNNQHNLLSKYNGLVFSNGRHVYSYSPDWSHSSFYFNDIDSNPKPTNFWFSKWFFNGEEIKKEDSVDLLNFNNYLQNKCSSLPTNMMFLNYIDLIEED